MIAKESKILRIDRGLNGDAAGSVGPASNTSYSHLLNELNRPQADAFTSSFLAFDVAVANRFVDLTRVIQMFANDHSASLAPFEVCVLGPGGGLAGASPQLQEILLCLGGLVNKIECSVIDVNPFVLQSADTTVASLPPDIHRKVSLGLFKGLFEKTQYGSRPQAHLDLIVATTAMEYALDALDSDVDCLMLFGSLLAPLKRSGAAALVVDTMTARYLAVRSGESSGRSAADIEEGLEGSMASVDRNVQVKVCGDVTAIIPLFDRL